MTDSEQTAVAYLSIHNAPEGKNRNAYTGGALVIDGEGIPLEFRRTSPLSPSGIQRAIYGNTLEPHIFSELIGVPLLQSLVNRPQWCVVEDGRLLSLRERVDFPVFQIQEYRGTSHGRPGASNLHHLKSEIENVKPIEVRTHQGFMRDYDLVRADFERLSSRIDPVEPFTRIGTALDTIRQSD